MGYYVCLDGSPPGKPSHGRDHGGKKVGISCLERWNDVMRMCNRVRWEMERRMGLMGTTPSSGSADCVDGFAGEYACENINLGAFVSHEDLGSSTRQGSDIW